MKVNELMIGDYVKYKSSKCIIQIESILDDGVNYEYCQGELDCIDEEKIEPIPLTEEILKENGWSKEHMEYEEYMWRCPEGCTYLTQYNTHGQICLEETDIELNYVHELQHALRLCGLNDLADNFKVE